MRFDWDPEKAARNVDAHGITFDEATTLFTSGVPVFEIYDPEHSDHEDRFKSIGPIEKGIVVVVWTERDDDVVRIISVWRATKLEQAMYREFSEVQDE